MGKPKQKIIYNKKISEQKRALRIPTPKTGEDFKDKKAYTRKEKHK